MVFEGNLGSESMVWFGAAVFGLLSVLVGVLLADAETFGIWRNQLRPYRTSRFPQRRAPDRLCICLVVPDATTRDSERPMAHAWNVRGLVSVCETESGLVVRTRGLREIFGGGVPLAMIPWDNVQTYRPCFLEIRNGENSIMLLCRANLT